MKSTGLLKSVLLCGALIAAGNSKAQLLAPNVFLQGKYVEVGITANGDYGAPTSPSGYHPHLGSGGGVGTPLGFVADYGMDGWAVGTPPYMGDYFYPGSPFEGWELQVDTGRCQAFNDGTGAYVGSYAGSGSNTGYAVSGSTTSGTWQGMVDSVAITQVTTVDTMNLFFTVKVTLTNLSYLPKNDIYYLRSLDPDNDESWPGGSFFTNNVVEHQSPDSTVVSATGLTGAYTMMALGTVDTPAIAFSYNAWPLSSSVDLSTVYNQTFGPATYAVGVNSPGDIGIGLVIKIAHLATVDSAGDSVARQTAEARLHPANSATFTFFYAFTTSGMDSAISAGIKAKKADTIATVSTGSLGVKNVSISDDIKVYPNPAENIVNITGLTVGDQITMYDMMGRVVNQAMAINRTVNTLSMSNVATGAYILVVNDAGGNVKARVPLRKM